MARAWHSQHSMQTQENIYHITAKWIHKNYWALWPHDMSEAVVVES